MSHFILIRRFNRCQNVWWGLIRTNSTRVENWSWWWIWIIPWSTPLRCPASAPQRRYCMLRRSGNRIWDNAVVSPWNEELMFWLNFLYIYNLYVYIRISLAWIHLCIDVYYFLQNIFEMKLEGSPTYYVRLRPYYKEFLEKISQLYELNIFTFACRSYAKTVAGKSCIILLTLKFTFIYFEYCWKNLENIFRMK